MKNLPSIFLFLMLCSVTSNAQVNAITSAMQNKPDFGTEELTYEISWLAFDLGTVTLIIQQNGDTSYSASCYIDSYNIPLADIHSVFKTVMDNRAVSREFTGLDKEKNTWSISKYIYNKDKTLAFINSGSVKNPEEKEPKLSVVDTMRIDPMTQDGLSLFYYARKQLRCRDTIIVKTLVSEKLGSATINFYGRENEIEIDAVTYPISTIEFDGKANYEGVFGLSGEFKGWFSNDDAHVPIKAKVGVLLGSVNVELIKWKKADWIPPRNTKKNFSSE